MPTTIVNSNPPQTQSNNGIGILLGIIALIIFFVVLLYYGIPYLENRFTTTQINIPNHIDVNVKGAK